MAGVRFQISNDQVMAVQKLLGQRLTIWETFLHFFFMVLRIRIRRCMYKLKKHSRLFYKKNIFFRQKSSTCLICMQYSLIMYIQCIASNWVKITLNSSLTRCILTHSWLNYKNSVKMLKSSFKAIKKSFSDQFSADNGFLKA